MQQFLLSNCPHNFQPVNSTIIALKVVGLTTNSIMFNCQFNHFEPFFTQDKDKKVTGDTRVSNSFWVYEIHSKRWSCLYRFSSLQFCSTFQTSIQLLMKSFSNLVPELMMKCLRVVSKGLSSEMVATDNCSCSLHDYTCTIFQLTE